MIHRIVAFSARNRALVLLITLLACLAGWHALRAVPVDAVPDLSETQVVIVSQWDRNPGIIEDQVTSPIVNALTGAPKVKAVRGISDFGASFVYVIFEEGTDLYWARSRTQEYLSPVLQTLPTGVSTRLGPDATSLGWVFQYAVVDRSGQQNSAQLRSLQDWYIRKSLKSVKGVSEIATVGGFTPQYQVNVDPDKLRARGVDLRQVVQAVRESNAETGARVLEFGDTGYMVRGVGYLKSLQDLRRSVVATSPDGSPVTLDQLGQVVLGPDIRQGAADLDGQGETVTGIVLMRDGENVADVLRNLKSRLHEIQPGLPKGVEIVPVYDRSRLVDDASRHLRRTLIEVIVTVTLVVFLFLWHVPSAIIPALTIPAALLICFLPFHALGMSANIMSLCGLTIAVGALVDASIVVVEQTHKRLELWREHGSRGDVTEVIVRAVQEVARPSFFALLIIAVSFLPVLGLQGEEGKMFRPLAYTKTLAMLVGAILAITFDPALRLTLMKLRFPRLRGSRFGRVLEQITEVPAGNERRNPVTRWLVDTYQPVLEWALAHRAVVLGLACAAMLLTIPVAAHLGSEFMPSIEEGALLYMPSLPQGISIAAATRYLHNSDQLIKTFPEVDHVLGKAGRADTATDPAPLSMLETVITLKPQDQWPKIRTWYSNFAPKWMFPLLRHITPDHETEEEFIARLDRTLQAPGVVNGWTMPIQGRITMLSTGIKTPLGIKISGTDLPEIQRLEDLTAAKLRNVGGARSIYAERSGEGYYVDIRWNRESLARFGITIQQAQDALSTAVGGDNVSTIIDGRARYPVNVRYERDYREDLDALQHVLIPTSSESRQIPLGELADVVKTNGPSMIRDEDGLLTGYVYIDLPAGEINGFVQRADKALADMTLPVGYDLRWTGQFESMARLRSSLRVVIPVTLLIVAGLLWLNTRSLRRTAIVLLAVPFSAVGAFWFLSLLGYSMSVAVWIGLIALLGVDAETGTFMLLYLDLTFQERAIEGRLETRAQVREAVIAGAAHRIRPKFMTVATMFLGLAPIMWSSGPGSSVMKHIAAPMIGGLVTSFCLELLLYPLIYEWLFLERSRSQITHRPAEVMAS